MALSTGIKLTDLSQQQIAELQNLLLRAGYNPGPVDGILGPQTKNAYTRFLGRNGHAGRGTDVITKLTADLWSNAIPELWNGITFGGEVNASSTTGGQGNPAAAQTAASTATAPAAASTGTPAATPAAATPFTPATDASTETDVRNRYPHLAYLLDNPEVKDVLMRATQGGWDQATLQGELWKTQWWQHTSNATRLWDQKFAQDNATALLEWDQRTVTISNLATQMGFNLSGDDTKWIAGRVLREGWSDEQLRRFLGTLARQSGIGHGQVTDQAASFKSLAKNYMSTLSDQQALEYAIRVAEGSYTREGVESLLRDEAKGRFYWLAPQIDSGMSPMDLFGSMRNAVAQELEMDPNQIDLSDPRWSALTTPIQENGATRSMNFYEAQRWARQRPEWRFTDNANKQAAQIELDLLKTMGVLAGN